MAMEKRVEQAYEVLEKKIVNSKEYGEFLYDITTDIDTAKLIETIFTFDDGLDLSYLNEILQNFRLMREFSEMINVSDKFDRMIIKAVSSNNAIDAVVDTHFAETKYGNIDKEDLTNTDALFPILESVLGLDTIIDGISNKNVLLTRFNKVMEDNTGLSAEEFTELFQEIFDKTKDLTDYNEIKKVINSEYRNQLIPFINMGTTTQLREITNDPNGSFETYSRMEHNLFNVIDKGKNNVK